MLSGRFLVSVFLAITVVVAQNTVSSVLANQLKEGRNTYEPTAPLKEIRSIDDFDRWSTYYYLFPQPDLTVKAIFFAERNGLLDLKGMFTPLSAFIGQVMADNQAKVPGWLNDLSKLKWNHRGLIWTALRLCGTGQSRKQAARLLLTLPQVEQERIALADWDPKPILTMPVRQPDVIEMLWGCFRATGDKRYVERVISVLPEGKKGERDVDRILVGTSAAYSLAANAVQHRRVLQICKEYELSHPDLKEFLDPVIEKASVSNSIQLRSR